MSCGIVILPQNDSSRIPGGHDRATERLEQRQIVAGARLTGRDDAAVQNFVLS
jgi:hypothetical protein